MGTEGLKHGDGGVILVIAWLASYRHEQELRLSQGHYAHAREPTVASNSNLKIGIICTKL